MPGAETFLASAEAYDRFVGRYSGRLAEARVEFAGIEPGIRALDVGAGPGALTAALVSRVGPGSVTAAEPSEPFAKACAARVPEAEVVVAGAEQLPFADDAFDAVLSQLVVNFIGDPLAGIREMTRVTRDGGVVASCVWDYADAMTLLRTYWDAAREVEPGRAAAADEAVVMQWCREGELADLWERAGLRDVRAGELVVSASYESFEQLWAPLPTGIAPAGAFCASLPEDKREQLKAAYKARLGIDDGPFELTARAWAAIGSA
jgi:SAM-dependent methyltransferase